MTQDAWLAVAHHLAVFGLLALIATEWGLLVIGLARLEFGAKDWDFYTGSPFFWLKLASFAAVGLISIGPTRRYVRWAKTEAAPDESHVQAARRGLQLQLATFSLIRSVPR